MERQSLPPIGASHSVHCTLTQAAAMHMTRPEMGADTDEKTCSLCVQKESLGLGKSQYITLNQGAASQTLVQLFTDAPCHGLPSNALLIPAEC